MPRCRPGALVARPGTLVRRLSTLDAVVDVILVVALSIGATLSGAPGLQVHDGNDPILVAVGVGLALAFA